MLNTISVEEKKGETVIKYSCCLTDYTKEYLAGYL